MTNRKQVTQSPRPAPDIEAIIFCVNSRDLRT